MLEDELGGQQGGEGTEQTPAEGFNQEPVGGEGEGTNPENVFEIDGVQYDASDREKVREAFEAFHNKGKWQREYTQRDMTLAEERKSIATARQLEEFLKQNPQAFNEVQGVFKKYTPAQVAQMQSTGNPALERKFEELEFKLQVKEYEDQIGNEMAQLESKFSQYFKEDPKLKFNVVKYAQDNNISSMDAAFRAVMFDRVQKDQYKTGIQAGRKAGTQTRAFSQPGGSASSGGKKAPSVHGMSDDDIRTAILNDPEIMNMSIDRE